MQELRITLKVTVPIDDTDAFLMAQALLDAKSRIQDAGNMLAGNAGLVEVVSKLVTPRRATLGEMTDSENQESGSVVSDPGPTTTLGEVVSLAQAQTAAVSEAHKETAEPVTDLRTAPWRRAIKVN